MDERVKTEVSVMFVSGHKRACDAVGDLLRVAEGGGGAESARIAREMLRATGEMRGAFCDLMLAFEEEERGRDVSC